MALILAFRGHRQGSPPASDQQPGALCMWWASLTFVPAGTDSAHMCICFQYAATHTQTHTHTPNTHHDHQQHHDHNDTHHTTQHTTSHGDRERQRERERETEKKDRERETEKERQRKKTEKERHRKRDKTREDKKTREDEKDGAPVPIDRCVKLISLRSSTAKLLANSLQTLVNSIDILMVSDGN